MTGNESELIERLIVEAAKRGAVELQLNRAVEAGEEAGKVIESQRLTLRKIGEQVDRLNARADEAEKPLATFYQAAIFLMREVTDPTKHLRKQRIDAAIFNLRKASAAAAQYCNEIPF